MLLAEARRSPTAARSISFEFCNSRVTTYIPRSESLGARAIPSTALPSGVHLTQCGFPPSRPSLKRGSGPPPQSLRYMADEKRQ